MKEEQLDLITDDPRGLSEKDRLKAWKIQWGVWTNYAHGVEPPWTAIAIDKAHEMLKGSNLTVEELAEPMALFAGYCRLLDEMGLMYEAQTEMEACERIARRWGYVMP